MKTIKITTKQKERLFTEVTTPPKPTLYEKQRKKHLK